MHNRLCRIAKLYFPDITLPKYEGPDRINLPALNKYIKKEIPHFDSDDRVQIIKNNKKLKDSYSRHQRLVNKTMDYFAEKGFEPIQMASVDLAVRKRNLINIIEVKSCDYNNIESQIKHGLSQLFYYHFLASLNKKYNGYCIKKVLVLEKRPSEKLIEFIINFCDTALLYKENKILIKPEI